MGVQAKQPTLFPSPQPAAPAADNSEFVRREMQRLLWIVRTAERLPWSEVRTATWEKLFADLAPSVPEGAELLDAFRAELARLRQQT